VFSSPDDYLFHHGGPKGELKYSQDSMVRSSHNEEFLEFFQLVFL